MKIKEMLTPRIVKAVVSLSIRYENITKKVHDIIASGALGRLNTVYGTATG